MSSSKKAAPRTVSDPVEVAELALAAEAVTVHAELHTYLLAKTDQAAERKYREERANHNQQQHQAAGEEDEIVGVGQSAQTKEGGQASLPFQQGEVADERHEGADGSNTGNFGKRHHHHHQLQTVEPAPLRRRKETEEVSDQG